MTSQLLTAIAELIATARAAHPTCHEWQLTMNPETYLAFGPDQPATRITRQTVVSYYDGCRIWQEPTWADVVVCSPMVDPGTWDLPPEYYLDLRDNSIATDPPVRTRVLQAAQGARG